VEELRAYTRDRENEFEMIEVKSNEVMEDKPSGLGTNSHTANAESTTERGPEHNTTVTAMKLTLLTETVRHLKLGLHLISDTIGDRIEEEAALHRKDPASCTWRMLWLIFPPRK
jgi:hypothetical protein